MRLVAIACAHRKFREMRVLIVKCGLSLVVEHENQRLRQDWVHPSVVQNHPDRFPMLRAATEPKGVAEFFP